MATLAQIRDGIQTRLQTISGLRAYDTWPDQANFPAAIVRPKAMSTKTAMGDGRRVLTFEIVLAAAALQKGVERAQDALDAYLDETGASSVIAALEGDVTLGGTATTLDVEWTEYGSVELPADSGIRYAGARFEVTVWP